jgi:AAA15 family ATPase/GTPase
LIALQETWAEILDIMGLYFDAESAKLPFQLTDNLEAHIKIKKTNQVISYNQLSTGIRNFIFKIGYLKSLFFGQENLNAIAFVDEPENSLFPDVLANIVETYTKNAPNTQFFFATHSPIVASQFEPCERIILDFDDEKNVIIKKGVAPEGDDPNDLLTKDFGVANLLGKKGKQQLERYIELKALIKFSNNETEKEQYLREFSEIGNLYGF